MDVEFTGGLKDHVGTSIVGVFDNLDREQAKYLSTHWGDDNWWNEITQPKNPLGDEPDHHWDWVGVISSTVLNKPLGRSVCIKSPDGVIQGAMIYRFGAKSALEHGKKVVYVDRLATAPRNRSNLLSKPQFSRVGKSLLRYAMVESLSYGLEGRVAVYPIANESFYVEQKLIQTDEYDEEHQVFLWELPAEAAQETLKTLGVIS